MKKLINRYIIRKVSTKLNRELTEDERNKIYKISHIVNEEFKERLEDEVETLSIVLKQKQVSKNTKP